MQQRVGERAEILCITRTIKLGGESEMVWGGPLTIAKSGICNRWWANWIRPDIIEYCIITWSHLERGLWLNYLHSCKIMPQSTLLNFTWDILKANSTSFPAQTSDLNRIKRVWDELNQKVSSISHKCSSRLSPVFGGRMPRKCNAVIAAKVDSFWWITNLRIFLCFGGWIFI